MELRLPTSAVQRLVSSEEIECCTGFHLGIVRQRALYELF